MSTAARERVRTVGFMVAVTFVIAAVLTLIQLGTAERVARNERLFLQRAILEAGGVAVPADDLAALALYGERVREASNAVPVHYAVHNAQGQVQAYVLLRQGMGLWGKLVAAMGVDPRRETMVGMVFTAQGETPGLGARIEEPAFRRQFAGRVPPFRRVPEDQADLGTNEIHSITGATITTRAVQDMAETLLAEAKRIIPASE